MPRPRLGAAPPSVHTHQALGIRRQVSVWETFRHFVGRYLVKLRVRLFGVLSWNSLEITDKIFLTRNEYFVSRVLLRLSGDRLVRLVRLDGTLWWIEMARNCSPVCSIHVCSRCKAFLLFMTEPTLRSLLNDFRLHFVLFFGGRW